MAACFCFSCFCVFRKQRLFSLFLLFFPYTELAEKVFQHFAAFFLQHIAGHLDLVVELRHFQKIQDRACASGFWIHTADHNFTDARLNDGAGTHLAWFQRNVKGTAFQTPVSQFFARLADGVQFGVGEGVFVRVAAVVAAGNDLVLIDDDASDGDLFEGGGLLCLFDGFTHVMFFSGHSLQLLFSEQQPTACSFSGRMNCILYSTIWGEKMQTGVPQFRRDQPQEFSGIRLYSAGGTVTVQTPHIP